MHQINSIEVSSTMFKRLKSTPTHTVIPQQITGLISNILNPNRKTRVDQRHVAPKWKGEKKDRECVCVVMPSLLFPKQKRMAYNNLAFLKFWSVLYNSQPNFTLCSSLLFSHPSPYPILSPSLSLSTIFLSLPLLPLSKHFKHTQLSYLSLTLSLTTLSPIYLCFSICTSC